MKQIAQIRYYGEPSPENPKKNQPTNLSLLRLTGGSAFSSYYPITQLSIETKPGTEIKFYINGNRDSVLISRTTGVFKLDLEGLSEITQLKFDGESLKKIKSGSDDYLVINVVGGQN